MRRKWRTAGLVVSSVGCTYAILPVGRCSAWWSHRRSDSRDRSTFERRSWGGRCRSCWRPSCRWGSRRRRRKRERKSGTQLERLRRCLQNHSRRIAMSRHLDLEEFRKTILLFRSFHCYLNFFSYMYNHDTSHFNIFPKCLMCVT